MFLVFFLTCCTPINEEVRANLKSCVLTETQHKSLFTELASFEKFLIEKKYLTGRDKEDYQRLSVQIFENNLFIRNGISLEFIEFQNLTSQYIFSAYSSCSVKVYNEFFSEEMDHYSLYEVQSFYKTISQKNKIIDKKMMTHLLTNLQDSDFQHLEFRAAILIVIANFIFS